MFQEEIFGPVLALIKADSIHEAFELVNNVNYGLAHIGLYLLKYSGTDERFVKKG
jgi:acyl-CoA reductase-like NAD-dependent aldehyde dehydrogenase